MAAEVDVVVVGAGLMGAAAAWSAARRGLSVQVLEQFAAGHRNGSSHGSARIVRRAYGDGLYVRLTGRAFELWRELERDAGTPLLRTLGGLDFGPRRDVARMARLLTEAAVEHEVLTASAAEQRWLGMRFDGPVLFHPQAATVDSAAAVTAMLDVARRLGAQVRFAAPVTAVQHVGDRVRLSCADGTSLHARRAIVAAGAWLGPLLGGGFGLPALRVTQQQLFHFPRLDAAVPPWPSVIHEDVRGIYHLAGGRDGGPGDARKIGEHDTGHATTAATRDDVVDPQSRARVIEYVQRWLPGLDPVPQGEATCLYTSTPSEDLLLDRVGPIVVCSACSGHGAKFAPLIGELAVGLATGDGEVPERFRLAAHACAPPGAVSL